MRMNMTIPFQWSTFHGVVYCYSDIPVELPQDDTGYQSDDCAESTLRVEPPSSRVPAGAAECRAKADTQTTRHPAAGIHRSSSAQKNGADALSLSSAARPTRSCFRVTLDRRSWPPATLHHPCETPPCELVYCLICALSLLGFATGELFPVATLFLEFAL